MAYSIARERALVFVAAFGATHAVWGLCDLSGSILATHGETLHISAGPHGAADAAHAAMTRLLTEAGRTAAEVGAIAIGLPSPIDSSSKRPVNPSAMPGWVDVDVRRLFGDVFGRPVAVENDAKLMALGAHATDWSAVENLVFIKVATGVGAGIISDGRLQAGGRGLAGELGHNPVPGGTRACDCGNVGCIARYASITGVAESLREVGVEVSTLEEITSLVSRGDPTVARVLRQAGRHLGEIVASLLGITNPDEIILGGTLASSSEDLLAGMREVLFAKASPYLTVALQTSVASNHDEVGIRGGAVVALKELLDSVTHQ
jgi:predicted NBD/HSP70 family sugar kinase